MSLTEILYATNILSSLDDVIVILLIIIFLYFSVALFITAVERNNSWDSHLETAINTQKKWVIEPFKKNYGKIICLLIATILIPSDKTMYLMVGSKYLSSTNIPAKVEAILNKKLDEYLVEKKIDNNKIKGE